MNTPINYFVGINRVLTNALSGVIATAICFGTYYGLSSVTAIQAADSLNFSLFLILSTSLFLANLVFQSLQNYFCKLLEKDKYTTLGKKSLDNFMANILLGTILIPLAFALYTQTTQAGFIILFIQFYFAFILGLLIREENRRIIISSLFGVIVAGVLALILVLISSQQSLGLGVTVGIISIVLVGVCSSLAELIGTALQNLIKPQE